MRQLAITALVLAIITLSSLALVQASATSTRSDPCDSYRDCVSVSIAYGRANPDDSLYLGDQFSIGIVAVPASGSSGSVSWSSSLKGITWTYDARAFNAATDGQTADFLVAGNETGSYTITATAAFLVALTTCTTSSSGQTTCSISYAQTSVPVTEQVSLRAFVMTFQTRLVNVTGADGFALRNEDGTFYRNDSFCDSWNATFLFASERTDIRVNVSSVATSSIGILNYSADPLGRSGRFCYAVRGGSAYEASAVVLKATALDWQSVLLGEKESDQPFAVVRYDPHFTTYAYMEYRNSTASSSLRRPWVLFVRYDGNDPGYSYAGDSNTLPFNESRTLEERAFFDSFTFTSLSYEPFNSSGVFMFHVTNSTGSLRYDWLDQRSSTPMWREKRIEKYLFDVAASSMTPLLSRGYIYQNITMQGCWTHKGGCYLRQNYWLVPFLWNGKINIVSVDSDGNLLPTTPLSIVIHSPSPLDDWLTNNFEHVFGNDQQALRVFQEDLYPTNRTMTFTGEGTLSLLLNQTSLVPPEISITAGGVTQSGNFTFVPVFVNSMIMSIPNSLDGIVFYSNATIPLWSYNMVQGSFAFLPISTTINYPSTFLELVNSSGWLAGNTTAPQTPSAFTSQHFGFWPLGRNLTVYVNLQGGGIKSLGTQKIGANEYQASFYIGPWSGGISRVQLLEGDTVAENESCLNTNAYPSPLPQAFTGQYAVSYSATGKDTKVVFTNVWGSKTAFDLGIAASQTTSINLIPETTAIVFGVAGIVWFIASGILKTRKARVHE